MAASRPVEVFYSDSRTNANLVKLVDASSTLRDTRPLEWVQAPPPRMPDLSRVMLDVSPVAEPTNRDLNKLPYYFGDRIGSWLLPGCPTKMPVDRRAFQAGRDARYFGR